uniref:Uncharacterized protein n=1 Tax=Ananas comosus var. bracteatus TaxID=296719 RepID=A0A6V7QTG3_ANACO
MMIQSSIPLVLLALPVFAVLSSAQDFDFFYFVQQWPGSYCDTKQSCCYPTPESHSLISESMACGPTIMMDHTHRTVIAIILSSHRNKCRDKVEFPVFPSITEEGQSSFE